MSRRWASSASQSWVSVMFCRSGVTGASPGLISITGSLAVAKLLSMATGFESGSASRRQRTWRVVHSPGYDLQVGQVEILPELRIVERHLHPERPEALNTLQLPELERLDVTSQIAEALQVFDVPAVFQRLRGLRVDDGYLPGLSHALGRSLHDRLVDALLDDLVPDVVGAVDVEPLLVESKTDRERGMLDENQVCRFERHGKVIPKFRGAHCEPARDHQLPQAKVLQAQGVRAPVFQEARPHVDLVVDAIGLLLLEIVREHPLRRLILEVQVGGGAFGDPGDALLEQPAAMVHGTEPSVEALPVGRNPVAGHGTERSEMIQQALDLSP